MLATDDEFAEENARNALNWQIMLTIYSAVSAVLVFVLIGNSGRKGERWRGLGVSFDSGYRLEAKTFIPFFFLYLSLSGCCCSGK
jgi:hypothetical protein